MSLKNKHQERDYHDKQEKLLGIIRLESIGDTKTVGYQFLPL